MKTVYSDKHKLHAPAKEIMNGEVINYFEKTDRAEFVLDAVTKRRLGDIIGPESFGLDSVLTVHDAGYIDFLQTAHEKWAEEGNKGDVFPTSYNVQHPQSPVPECVTGKAGIYMADGCVPITATSWQAIESAAQVALTGHRLVSEGENSAFALCRPPGHHATGSVAAGYCFINNAAVAAQAFLEGGAARVALLDVDYHHGNGTQDIFYRRDDVLFLSIHADPNFEYPYFCGYAHEKGEGKGEGYTVNYPLALGSDYGVYDTALENAISRIKNYGPDVLVISLGVDTYKDDPISHFKLEGNDYIRMGSRIAQVGCPTLFVMEGGYAVAEIGENVANVLGGFLDL